MRSPYRIFLNLILTTSDKLKLCLLSWTAMHQITIRLLLGIVITVSQYKTQTSADCGGFRRMSTTVNCRRALSSKAVYLNLHQHKLEYYFVSCFILQQPALHNRQSITYIITSIIQRYYKDTKTDCVYNELVLMIIHKMNRVSGFIIIITGALVRIS